MMRLTAHEITQRATELAGDDAGVHVVVHEAPGGARLRMKVDGQLIARHVVEADLHVTIDEFADRYIRRALMIGMRCLSCGVKVSGTSMPCGH
ncbi:MULTISPECIES: hypothetical protein [Burkholderia]|uniref:hypothetical protein n=1 Tax=Burkholderia TaxID=32008 RepID=UPI000B79CB33|nr:MULTISPECIES: hypothetical protein [Burkholderia]MBY4723982.1 hypothetical protein [Burkholderia contaminans]MCI3970822.1 hypothetical protein [Burkholderia sp. HI4860]OXJ04431.1 hypothetical protein CFB48_06670 [Burkholderia sp. AU33647]